MATFSVQYRYFSFQFMQFQLFVNQINKASLTIQNVKHVYQPGESTKCIKVISYSYNTIEKWVKSHYKLHLSRFATVGSSKQGKHIDSWINANGL